MMNKYIRECAYYLLLCGGLAGFALALVASLLAGADPEEALCYGALGCFFGGFLVRAFLSVLFSSLREFREDSNSDEENSADKEDTPSDAQPSAQHAEA